MNMYPGQLTGIHPSCKLMALSLSLFVDAFLTSFSLIISVQLDGLLRLNGTFN